MNFKKRLFIIVAGILLIVFAAIGYAGQNFNLGAPNPGELYADNFANILLLATAMAGISAVLAVTRLKTVSILATAVFLGLLVINNPWAYHGINVGFVENPWTNPALAALLAAAFTVNAYALIMAFRPRP